MRDGPELIIIAALSEKDRLIGRGDQLPWHLPDDLRRFKRLTLGYPLLIGRKTFEAILSQFGRPLPGRRHIVLTRSPEKVTHPVAECFGSLPEALDALKDETKVYIAGGGEIYSATIELADWLELTLVEGDYKGDAYFPEWEHLVGSAFQLVETVPGDGYRFETYKRNDI